MSTISCFGGPRVDATCPECGKHCDQYAWDGETPAYVMWHDKYELDGHTWTARWPAPALDSAGGE